MGASSNQPVKRPHEVSNPKQKRLYTLKEAAEYLGRSEWGMRELIWGVAFRLSGSKEGERFSWTLKTWMISSTRTIRSRDAARGQRGYRAVSRRNGCYRRIYQWMLHNFAGCIGRGDRFVWTVFEMVRKEGRKRGDPSGKEQAWFIAESFYRRPYENSEKWQLEISIMRKIKLVEEDIRLW